LVPKLESLRLISAALIGGIPEMLGSMKSLRVLILSYYHLTGLIPTTYASSNIRTFLVDHNKLSGTIDPITTVAELDRELRGGRTYLRELI
jgi:hypothetical protein